MNDKRFLFYGGLFSLLLAGCSQPEQVKENESAAPSQQVLLEQIAEKSNESLTVASFNVPLEYFTLDNGLKVVLSPDDTAPTVTVAVYYNIGFRN
jgi:zinc protease